ncbi:hypothetical protein PAECIP111802_06815 [Paenibacillus allorhizosphaerae]|uniref:Integrase catalytic domain-containing protein n=1 Tax=Paenibacillus allorhizosphaerae TaxID=2849866 RepID=A0ABN7TWM8_9BACL|nr:hypothetical protein PAECIP111802_06815 [Paenibacillus allorhizosphaerae]
MKNAAILGAVLAAALYAISAPLFKSIDHFKQELDKYIDYYNNKRAKTKLKGMSPVKFRTHALQAA